MSNICGRLFRECACNLLCEVLPVAVEPLSGASTLCIHAFRNAMLRVILLKGGLRTLPERVLQVAFGCEVSNLRALQVETPLELASGLSLSLDNRLFLKREDLQPVAYSNTWLAAWFYTSFCSPAPLLTLNCCLLSLFPPMRE